MKNWTEEEIKYIKLHYQEQKPQDIAKYLNRSLAAIFQRARILKLAFRPNSTDKYLFQINHLIGISGIYQITNQNNNKKYIGYSCNIGRRFKEHLKFLFHNNHKNKELQEDYNNNHSHINYKRVYCEKSDYECGCGWTEWPCIETIKEKGKKELYKLKYTLFNFQHADSNFYTKINAIWNFGSFLSDVNKDKFFGELHELQRGWIFSMLSLPPLVNGIIWSSVSLISGSLFLQAGQVKPYCIFNSSHSPIV